MTGSRSVLGIDSFSYHRYFGETSEWKQPLDIRWKLDDFIQRARELKVEAVSIQDIHLPEVNPENVTAIRQQLDDAGLDRVLAWGHPNGLEGGSNAAKVATLIAFMPVARQLGSSLLRIALGNQFTWRVPTAERFARLLDILPEVARAAELSRLTLVIENHADFSMKDLVSLVHSLNKPNIGICFDTGNAVRVGDDMIEAAHLALPWIRMVHLKDMAVQDRSKGDPTRWWPCAPLGLGDLPINEFISLMERNGYQGGYFIETTNMHTAWPDEDAAVRHNIRYLRTLLADRCSL